jgi:ABC-type oligopeptide transport system ATPase subunit
MKLQETPGSTEYSKVTFQYPTRHDVKILRGLDLQIQPGQTVALVGPSGCGKSTCIQLLQRFYEPSAGTVVCKIKPNSVIHVVWAYLQFIIIDKLNWFISMEFGHSLCTLGVSNSNLNAQIIWHLMTHWLVNKLQWT